jgi:hypothetical protein
MFIPCRVGKTLPAVHPSTTHRSVMEHPVSDTPKTPSAPPALRDTGKASAEKAKAGTNDSREERLASALRANLRRRKGAPRQTPATKRSLLDGE